MTATSVLAVVRAGNANCTLIERTTDNHSDYFCTYNKLEPPCGAFVVNAYESCVELPVDLNQ